MLTGPGISMSFLRKNLAKNIQNVYFCERKKCLVLFQECSKEIAKKEAKTASHSVEIGHKGLNGIQKVRSSILLCSTKQTENQSLKALTHKFTHKTREIYA